MARRRMGLWPMAVVLALVLSSCSAANVNGQPAAAPSPEAAGEIAKKINQPPVEPIIERDGNTVNIVMTAQVTDVEISEGVFYNAWTFNGTVPGPVIRVREGDIIRFTLKNLDPNIPHSMDFHAVHAAPSKKFIDVMPNEEGTFEYPANTPGVFMYSRASPPLANVPATVQGPPHSATIRAMPRRIIGSSSTTTACSCPVMPPPPPWAKPEFPR